MAGDSKLCDQKLERDRVHVIRDFQANRGPESPAQQLALESLDQILRFVFVDFDVLVAGDPEFVVLEDLHAGEELTHVLGNEVLDCNESNATGPIVRQRNEPGEDGGNLEPREIHAVGLRVSNAHRQVQRQARDIGERVCWVHSEWHQHREDLFGKELIEAFPVALGKIGPGLDVNVLFIEGWFHELSKSGSVALLEGFCCSENVVQHRLG